MKKLISLLFLFITLNLSSAEISLSWKDNSNNEEGFIIERQNSGGAFVELARVGEDITTYVDQNVPLNTTLKYRVKAFNAGGVSNLSNTITVSTTPPKPTKPNPPTELKGTFKP